MTKATREGFARCQWNRFWVRRGAAVALHRGYLLDPETDYGRTLNPGAVTFEEIDSVPCLALLGEPGIGKSDMLARVANRAKAEGASGLGNLYVDLRSYNSSDHLQREIFQSPRFDAWVNSTSTLEIFLDSLDECLVQLRTVAALLVDGFKKYPVSRLRLRVACRAAEWPALLDEELPQIWGASNYATYELAPLRRVDVAQLADLNGVSAKEFLAAVETQDVGEFAAIPLTVSLLLREFRLNQSLPASRIDIFRSGCLALCNESNLSRRAAGSVGSLEPGQRLAIAERIAAISIFCRRPVIETAETPDALAVDVATIDEIIGSVDVPHQSKPRVSAADVRETLGIALFGSASSTQRRWMHWSFAEFLAASWTATHCLTFPQQCDLLVQYDVSGEPRVVPQLREVAAWLAAMNPEFMKYVLEHDPAILLSSTAGETNDDIRERATTVLLSQLDRITGDIGDELALRFSVLRHPRLDQQLRPYILDVSKNVPLRRIAIEIAEYCEVQSISTALVAVALDRTENSFIRGRAAAAVAKLGDEVQRALLKPLLNEPDDDDPDDELKAAALEALSGTMSVEEILRHISPARRANYLGSYWGFVAQELPKRIQNSDLPAALRWVSGLTADMRRDFAIQWLVAGILARGWATIDEPVVVDLLAEVTRVRLSQYASPFGERDGERTCAPTLSDPARRALLAAIIPMLAGEEKRHPVIALAQHGLLLSADVPWLLVQLQSADQKDQITWSEAVQFVFDPRLSGHYDLVLEATQLNSSLRERVGYLFETIHLDSLQAANQRTAHYERMALEQPPVAKLSKHPPMQDMANKWLERIEGGDIGAWWRLNRDMTLEATSDFYPPQSEFEADLTKLPGWIEVDAATHDRYLTIAEKYLKLADPNNASWLGTDTFHRPAAAGYRALRLLYSRRPAALEALTEEDWGKWAAIVLAFPDMHPDSDASTDAQILSEVYRRTPSEVVGAFLKLIDRENAQHGRVFIHRRLEGFWDCRLNDEVLRKIRNDRSLKPLSVGSLLRVLLEHDCSEAIAHGLEAVVSPAGGDSALRVEAGVALLRVVPARAWATIKAAFLEDPAFGKALFPELASRSRHGNYPPLMTCLPEGDVADLYLWLSRHFIPADDPKHDDREAHFVGPRESVADFRDGLLRYLVEKGTPDAVAAVQKIADANVGDSSWLKHLAQRADTSRRRQTWEGVSPSALDTLERKCSARLVDSEEQLMELVAQSLGRLEADLHGTPPAVTDLWNGDRPKDEFHLSDYIVRHLKRDLGSTHGIVANREVRIRREESTDILIEAVSLSGGSSLSQTYSVVVEVKGCWNDELQSAMETQLKNRYLRDNSCRHGLYVVGWFRDSVWSQADYRWRRTPKWTLAQAREAFKKEARRLSEPATKLHSFVLDATHHQRVEVEC